MMRKKVITIREKPKQIPRQLPPMERPETPRNDSRSLNSARSSNLHNLSISRFSDLNEVGVSAFESIKELFESAQNTDDLAFAVQSFESASKSLEETKNFASYDLNAYHQLYPLLLPLVDKAPGRVLIQLVNALRHILNAIDLSETVKPQPPTTPKLRRGNSRLKKLEPLPPLDNSNPEQNDQNSRQKDSPTEHFNQFMSKILYKMSNDKTNDEIFSNPDLIFNIVALSGPSHKIDTRTYAVATLKNETHNASFRKILIKISNFPELFKVFESPTKKPQLLQQCAGVCRNLILDPENIDLLIKYHVHLYLFHTMIRFTDSGDYCFACFRILTKMSERPEVRHSVLKKFGDDKILTLFFTLLVNHPSNHQLLSRLAYVFADFASYEQTFTLAAGKITDPYSISVLTDVLSNPEILSDSELTALLLQVVANLSVDEECSSLLSFGDTIAKLFVGRTFKKDDRLGFNLLCTASNFTFHDHYWSPKELIEALPIAIISQHNLSIIEALRSLCNLALASNSMLIDSKIPELLGILMKHVNPDIVLYSLQTLANLINHAGIRRRFRSDGFVESLLEILEGDEIDELELEAVAALIMNFGAITQDEAQKFLDALDMFEIPPGSDIPLAFRNFLKQQLRVDC
ncbi:hypothetical protein TRFO_21855 [Tritrichomonas foetus]|uniref:Armadillo/beta-catenin-like repeat family protein n=1 Tax=Tritrichomonas foetus TaxID=1144522 RepID=A0A1J4KEE2_9EUKA|nr:hypothetical protein TRFO_21855 [Tritrichomonas foetus]|eukprot:OHT09288.1 hypothetical protein TRFO_21855 [Tritrichomonas foetus]